GGRQGVKPNQARTSAGLLRAGGRVEGRETALGRVAVVEVDCVVVARLADMTGTGAGAGAPATEFAESRTAGSSVRTVRSCQAAPPAPAMRPKRPSTSGLLNE